MKKTVLVLLSILVVLLPIIVVGIVYLTKETNFLNKSNFWYGYMAYFGTVSLAAVALWQNENANQTNKRMMEQQLHQKIGYFTISQTDGPQRKINKFIDMHVGQIYDIHGNLEEDKEKVLAVSLENVGEDVVFLKKITADINDITLNVPCQIGMVFKGESFKVFIDNTENYKSDFLRINIILEMSNSASCNYKQKLYIEGKNNNSTPNGTYTVECFKTNIIFAEDENNG